MSDEVLKVLVAFLVFANLMELFLYVGTFRRFSKNVTNLLSPIERISAQFKTDSGTSLRDVINRLEVAANDNRTLVRGLKSAIDVGGATGLRIEVQQGEVADNLQHKQDRADAIDVDADPGMASDAASRGAT
jgi:hypothetical protein